MSRPALIPYAGKPSLRPRWTKGEPVCFRKAKFENQGDNLYSIGVVAAELSDDAAQTAAALFRAGHDNVSIARLLECTPAAAANALSRIRDAGR